MRYLITYIKVQTDLNEGGKLLQSNNYSVTADSINHLRNQLDTLCDSDDTVVLYVEPMAPIYPIVKE